MSFPHKTNWPDVQRFLPNPSIWYPPQTFGCWFPAKAWKVEILLGNVLVQQQVRQKGKVSVLRQEEASSPFLHICVYAYLCRKKKGGELGKIPHHMFWFPSIMGKLHEGDPNALRPKAETIQIVQRNLRGSPDLLWMEWFQQWISWGLYNQDPSLSETLCHFVWLYGSWVSPTRDASIYLRVILFSNSRAYLY